MLKKEILEKFKKSDLSLNEEIVDTHKELLFDVNPLPLHKNTLNEVNNSKSQNLMDSFYMEEPRFNNQKGKNQRNAGNYTNNSMNSFYKNEWRGNQSSSQGGRNFSQNGGQNVSSKGVNVRDYINNLEMSQENSFKIEKAYFYADESRRIDQSMDYFYKFNDERKNLTNQSFDAFFNENVKEDLESIPVNSSDQATNYNFTTNKGKDTKVFTPVNIQMIFKINEKLKYPKGDPLWYIYHTAAKSSFGPVSSLQLVDIYNNKNIDGQSDVRFIDIFKIRNKGAFAYFKLKEIESQNFLRDCIDGSNLVKYIEELNKVKKEESAPKVEVKPLLNSLSSQNKKQVKNTKLVNYDEMYEPEGGKSKTSSHINKPIKSKNIPDEKNIVAISKCESIIDKELNEAEDENEKKTNNISNNNISKKKGSKKKMKGKLVEMDIKTGFFTISQQEKNYEPIYICGDLEENK